jgi:hypothetical protein
MPGGINVMGFAVSGLSVRNCILPTVKKETKSVDES